MNRARDDLLARAAFTRDENGHIARRDLFDKSAQLDDRRMLPDKDFFHRLRTVQIRLSYLRFGRFFRHAQKPGPPWFALHERNPLTLQIWPQRTQVAGGVSLR